LLSLVLAFALFAVVFQSGCQTDGVGLLPGPPAGELKFSEYKPESPYTELVPGLLTRTVHPADSGAGYRVEVRDFLVGPAQRTSQASLPGPAIFEIRSGGGLITAGGKSTEVRVGSTLAVPEGEAFTIENKGDVAITVRVHLFVAN